MREPGTPDYEPPAPGETLREWVASSSQDWLESQPTMWMPAVPAQPAVPAAGPPPAIPRQRGPQHSARRRSGPGAASGSAGRSEVQAADNQPRSDPVSRSGLPAMVAALLAAGLALTSWVGAAALAVVVGGWALAAATRQVRAAKGVRPDRVQRALYLATALVAAVAVGIGASTLWSAVT